MSPMKLLCVQSTFMSPMKVLCVQSILSTQKEEITRFLHFYKIYSVFIWLSKGLTGENEHNQGHGHCKIHTQSIEATWRALKNGLRHLHGSSPELLPTYLFQY